MHRQARVVRRQRRRDRTGAVLALAAAVLAAVASTSCGSSATPRPSATHGPGFVSGQITVNGTVRTYNVLDPSPQSASQKPLVIVLHGGKEEGSAMIDRTQFDQVAQAQRFVVVFPDGVEGHWNSGSCCGAVVVSASDELDFFNALLDRMSKDHRIDPARVYVAAFSSGAYMAYRLGCDMSSRITAIASVSGSMPDGPCAPQRPVSVLEIHGTADRQLPYAGGVAPGISDHTPSTVAMVTAWAQRDGCSTAPVSGGDSSVQTMRWSGCSAGTVVALDTVAGADHNWYSPRLTGPDASLDATDPVWRFFAPLAAS